MPSPPHTPTCRRRFSTLDQSLPSPISTQYSPTSNRSVRRLSTRSFSSPSSIEYLPLRDGGLDLGPLNGLDDAHGRDSNGVGNLADELAEAWEDVGETAQMHNLLTGVEYNGPAVGMEEHRGRPLFEIHHEMGFGMPIPYDEAHDNRSLSPSKQAMSSRPQPKASNVSDYDGSDYGDNTDFEIVEGLSASLEHRLSAIESLARRGTESNGSGSDEVVVRVAQALRELGLQAGVETNATRPHVAASLHSLHSSTADLITILTTLADNLNMLRQTTSLASRKLKAAKELVDELRREADLREKGIRWVETGNWDAKLSNRECKTICGDVVDGFRVVCEQWERTIQDSAFMEMAAG
ncbi:MAG: hypothetical protein Q9207_002718 [Kuettlingeria erythrocarpa]